VKQHLAIFDLDHTLIPIDSDYQWGQYLIQLGLVDQSTHAPRNAQFYNDYIAGQLDIDAYLAFQLEPLLKYDLNQVKLWRQAYAEQHVYSQIQSKPLELVRWHQARGDLCMIITGTNDFVTRPIADAFGIEHLIGTQLEVANNRFTGRKLGTASFREGKIVRLDEFLSIRKLSLQDFETSTFYSDSVNDIPLLERVTNPVATNPCPRLAQHAELRGWKTLHLFDQLVHPK
jgi:HAD superfamily hydrolase (TIGR01490 family)